MVDTDLGERIVQLADEPPSHIIMPAIHQTRADIGALFARELALARGRDGPGPAHRGRARATCARASSPPTRRSPARTSRSPRAGTLVVVTNEGNADLGMAWRRVHVACLGIEKLVPTLADLAVFLRLLARSATGQPISAYTSLVTGPRPARSSTSCSSTTGARGFSPTRATARRWPASAAARA